MILTKLKFITSALCKIKHSKSLLLQKDIKYKSTLNKKLEVNNEPIAFSQTEASKWKAKWNRENISERVWYTPIVVGFSLSTFLIYFCILREENDIDELIYRPLPESLRGIDKLYPWVDFYKKPDYVTFHEENKSKGKKPN